MDALTDDAIFLLASFLHPNDLVSLASTCKRFGCKPSAAVNVGGAVAKNNGGAAAPSSSSIAISCTGVCLNTNTHNRCWSLMEESARLRVTFVSQKYTHLKNCNLLSKQSKYESWIAVAHRLQMMNIQRMSSSPSPSTLTLPYCFYQFIGNGIEYVNGNATHVQVHKHALTSGQYPLGSSCALTLPALRSGRHYAEFVVTREGYIEIGIMRPIVYSSSSPSSSKNFCNWDPRNIRTFHPMNHKMYNQFCNDQQQRQQQSTMWNNVHCYFCQFPTDSYGRSNFLRNNDTVGLLLDLNEGTLSVYKNGRCLGVKKYGLAGHYCWVVSLTNVVYQGAVKIRSAPIPS